MVINLSHKLKQFRKSNGLSVKNLSVLSGIAVSTIYRIENGNLDYKINDGTAKALADVLEVKVEDLFTSLELSPNGRPPMTGTPLIRKYDKPGKVCPGCNYALPTTGVCDDCGVMPLVG